MQRQAQSRAGRAADGLADSSAPFDWRRKAARLREEFRVGGIRSAAAVVVRALSRAFSPWLGLEWRACMVVPWAEASALAHARPAPGARIRARWMTRAELAEYPKRPEYNITSAFLRGLCTRRDFCVGVFVDGELAGYSFLSVEPTSVDGPLEFRFPRGWVYVYKSFTHPRWRGQGLHGIGLLQAIRELDLSSETRYAGLVALVATDNKRSLRAFGRLGFRATHVFRSISVLAWSFCPGRAREGFEIRAR